MKIRSHMMDRFRQLSKDHQIKAVVPDEAAGTYDIQFTNKVTLRVNQAEYAALQPKIEIQPEAP